MKACTLDVSEDVLGGSTSYGRDLLGRPYNTNSPTSMGFLVEFDE